MSNESLSLQAVRSRDAHRETASISEGRVFKVRMQILHDDLSCHRAVSPEQHDEDQAEGSVSEERQEAAKRAFSWYGGKQRWKTHGQGASDRQGRKCLL